MTAHLASHGNSMNNSWNSQKSSNTIIGNSSNNNDSSWNVYAEPLSYLDEAHPLLHLSGAPVVGEAVAVVVTFPALCRLLKNRWSPESVTRARSASARHSVKTL